MRHAASPQTRVVSMVHFLSLSQRTWQRILYSVGRSLDATKNEQKTNFAELAFWDQCARASRNLSQHGRDWHNHGGTHTMAKPWLGYRQPKYFPFMEAMSLIHLMAWRAVTQATAADLKVNQ